MKWAGHRQSTGDWGTGIWWPGSRLPGRRLELLLCLLAVVSLAGLAWKLRQLGLATQILLVDLEVLLPAGLSVAAAGLLADDPARELLLSSARPARHTLAERLAYLWILGALLGILIVTLASASGVPLPAEGTERLFIWLPPLVFFTSAASTAALARGRALDGIFVALILVGGGFLAHPFTRMLCAYIPADAVCAAGLANPFLTLSNSADLFWPTNRLLWLGMGLGLFWVGQRLAGREEALLPGSQVEN